MQSSCCLSAAILVAIICHASFGQSRDYESELIKYLKNNITNYSPQLHPRLNASSPVDVTTRVLLGRLVSVESANQSVKLSLFMDASWDEERLVWDPSKFGDIKVINWESSQIWFPVIFVYNGIGDNQVLTPQIPVYLAWKSNSSTTVTASWRREFEFSCRFEMSKFPQDQQNCDLEFFYSDQGRGLGMVRPVRHSSYSFDELSIYQESSEWTMVSTETIATEKQYRLYATFPPISMPTFVVRIKIKRVSTYYAMNVVTPLLLLAFLQSFVFSLLPVNCDEKLGFGITIMLSYTVFLLLMDKLLPKSESMPAVGVFIILAMILSTVSLLFASLSKRLYFTSASTRMPAGVRAVTVQFLARLLCVNRETSTRVDPTSSPAASLSSVTKFDASDEANAAAAAAAAPAADGAVKTSDWVTAAFAVEKLTMTLCILGTAVIVGVLVIQPYA